MTTVIHFFVLVLYFGDASLAFQAGSSGLLASKQLKKRFITSTNNNNNNNNNVNVNINYNTVTTSSVTIVTTAVTCLHFGTSYGLGQSVHGTDGCSVCSCSQSGMLCSSLKCTPHVPEKTDFHKCAYNGFTYNFGDTFSHTDGCNKCLCALSTVECTDVATCQPKSDCTYQGVGYSSGQSFAHTDGCNLCQCTILGVICTSKTCTTTTTTTMAPYTCSWFGKLYHDGDVMPADGCHTCTCNHGSTTCNAGITCP